MSSDDDNNRKQEQKGEENTVELVPPYANAIEDFDNEDADADLELVVTEMGKTLHLHRWVLRHTSQWFEEVLRARKDAQFEWRHSTKKEVDKKVLVKALRFCYGETQSVGTKDGECCAMIATLMRLQVTCLDDVVGLLINFTVEEAKRKVETGVELLKACTRYSECCGSSTFSLNKKLAAIVLTKENICKHYKEIVDECLMMLPQEYLMLAEFGEPHTRCSEFCLRTKYVRYHPEMSIDDKQAMIVKCDWATLNSHELRELRLMDTIDKDELLEAYEKALEYSEIEKERANEMMRRAKKMMEERVKELEIEKNEETKRADEAERDREEWRAHAEEIEKEKEKKAKEAEEYKERAEKAEKEKENYQNYAETLDSILGNGLHTLFSKSTRIIYSCLSQCDR